MVDDVPVPIPVPVPKPSESLRLSTRAVHRGRPEPVADAPLNPPITMAATYVGGGEREYGRYTNPTWVAFEETLGDLEGGRALAFGSGLAAVATVLDLVGPGGVVVAPRHAYLGVLGQLGDLELRGRLRTELVDVSDTAAVVSALEDEDVALLWLESPTNPALEVADIAALVEAAHAVGVQVVVDNTFATPLLQRPLADGADIVLHSATKYLAGHSDAVIGALVVRDDALFAVLKARRDLLGAIPGTLEAYLALRGVRTLHLRVERAQANAIELARRLEEHPAISRVRYPGFGGIIAIELGAGALAADLLCRSTALWVFATSLGGVESTFERRRRWRTEADTIPESLVRLSVGVEDVEDLWSDLAQALDQIG